LFFIKTSNEVGIYTKFCFSPSLDFSGNGFVVQKLSRNQAPPSEKYITTLYFIQMGPTQKQICSSSTNIIAAKLQNKKYIIIHALSKVLLSLRVNVISPLLQ